jgi:hypothetical protein
MAKTAALIALSVIAIGFGVPAVCVYSTVYFGFNFIVTGIIAVVALLIAGAIGFFGIIQGPLGQSFEGPSVSEREKLNAMRAHQRATLEELDDIIGVLTEIRDALKIVED